MKINCEHGYYKFYTAGPSELYRFKTMFGIGLTAKEDFFTFPELAGLAPYSLENQSYGGIRAKASICASYGEIFKVNSIVFNVITCNICKLQSITDKLELYRTWSGSFNCVGLPQAGGFYGGKRLIAFTGVFDKFFKICEIYGAKYENA